MSDIERFGAMGTRIELHLFGAGDADALAAARRAIEAVDDALTIHRPSPTTALNAALIAGRAAAIDDDVARRHKRVVPNRRRDVVAQASGDHAGRLVRLSEYDETTLQVEAFGKVCAGKRLPGVLKQAYHACVASLLDEQTMELGDTLTWPSGLVTV